MNVIVYLEKILEIAENLDTELSNTILKNGLKEIKEISKEAIEENDRQVIDSLNRQLAFLDIDKGY